MWMDEFKKILAQYTENKMPLGVAEQLSKLYEAGHNAEDILSFVLMTSSEGDSLLKQYADLAGIESGVEQAITNIAPTGRETLAKLVAEAKNPEASAYLEELLKTSDAVDQITKTDPVEGK